MKMKYFVTLIDKNGRNTEYTVNDAVEIYSHEGDLFEGFDTKEDAERHAQLALEKEWYDLTTDCYPIGERSKVADDFSGYKILEYT